ncbi:MAG: FISUMP domain-containing protein [Candidatus Moraniibacteriota bacterium]
MSGTGTTNYLSKFTGASSIGNSLLFDNGTGIGIGTETLAGARFKVALDSTYSNITDPYTDETKIASIGGGEVTGGKLQISSWICGIDQVADADENSYDSVHVGSQCWMASNLKVGTKTVSGPSNNGIIEKWCYSNSDGYCASDDGGLYSWNEAMQYSDTEGTRGICPDGWHIPTDAQQFELENYLKDSGQSCVASRNEVWECSTAGTKLKTDGTSGLDFLLSGFRNSDGLFYGNTGLGYYWSSSQNGSNAWFRNLSSAEPTVARRDEPKAMGYSVRCLKDIESSNPYDLSPIIVSSVNLFSSAPAFSINNFHYNIATLPATSSIRIQFSKDNTNWYSASGTLSAWTTISTLGGADIDLADFVTASSWTNGNAFYYKLEINSTTDHTQTPTIEDIRLDYVPLSGSGGLVFDTSGNLGVGTFFPTAKLSIASGGISTGLLADFSNGNAESVFTVLDNGSIGIGTTSPTAYLNIKAGTATAGTAPLKFTTGTLLSATEGGAMEFDGTHLYFTAANAGTRYQLDQQSGTSYTATNGLTLTANAFKLGGTLSAATDIALASNNLTFSGLGNIGIGTTTASYKLDVRGTNAAGQINAEGGLCINGDCKTSWSDAGIGTDTWTTTGSDIYFATGNVGIGTTTAPTNFKLQVNGNIGPNSDNLYSLGSQANRFNSIHLGPDNGIRLDNVYTDASNYEQGYLGYEGAAGTDSSLSFDTATESNFSQEDLAYNATLTPSATTGSVTLTLGSGNWNDNSKVTVGTRVKGNGGVATITSAPAAQTTITATVDTAFTNTNAIASGDWSLHGTNFLTNMVRLSGTNIGYDSDTFTKLLLHADGAGNSFVDNSTSANVITAHGDATQSIAGSKFGGESGYFDGAGDYLQIPYSSNFNFSSGDWSIDYWFNASALSGVMISKDTYGSSYDWGLSIQNSTTIRFSYNGSGYVDATVPALQTGQWYHLAAVESSGNFKIFLNGTSYWSGVLNPVNPPNLDTSYFTVGCASWNNPGYFFNGYLDEIRISKDVARWTSNFTPPTQPYGLGYPTDNYYTLVTTNTNHYNTSVWTGISSATLAETLNGQNINYSASFDNRTTFKIYDSTSGNSGWRPIARNNSGTWEYNSNATAGATNVTWTNSTTNNQNSAISQAVAISANQMTGTQFQAVDTSDWSTGFTPGTLDLAMSFKTTDSTQNPTLDQITINYLGGAGAGILTLGTKAIGSGTVRDLQIKAGDNDQLYLSSGGNIGIGTTSPLYKLDVRGVAAAGQINAEAGLCINGDCKTSWNSAGIGTDAWTTTGTDIYYSTGNVGIGSTSPAAKLDILSTITAGNTLSIANATAAQTTSTLLNIASSGYTTGFTGNVVNISGTSTTGTGTLLNLTSANTTNGNALKITADGLTTGVGMNLTSSGTITSGSLLKITTSGAGAVATNGLVSISASGAFTSTANVGLVNIASTSASQVSSTALNVVQSGTTTGYTGNFINFTGTSTTGTGTLLNLTSANTTNGNALKLTANALTTGVGMNLTSSGTITSGSLLRVTTSGAGAVATNGLVSISASGAFTSTANVGLVNIASTSASQVSGTALNVVQSGTTTGYTGNFINFTGTSTTGTGTLLNLSSANTTNGNAMKITANSLTAGTGMTVTSSSTGLTGNLVDITLTGNNAANTGTLLRSYVSGASSSAVPMMLTNLGTGLSFRVNDETGDADTTPFVINNVGNVGIGTTNPTSKLEVAGLGTFSGIPTSNAVSGGSLYVNPATYSSAVVVSWSAKSAWNDSPIDTYYQGGSFVDLDGNGVYDYMAGGYGTENYENGVAYQNVGTNTSPSWVTRVGWDISGMCGSYYTSVGFADLDNNGVMDAMIGGQDGQVCAVRNTGSASSPTWARQATWDATGTGGYTDSRPVFADLDGDGDLDMLVGMNTNHAHAYKNIGSASSPSWALQASWDTPANSGFSFALADLDNDGDYDLLGGSTDGKAYAYENTGGTSAPTWLAKTDWNTPDAGTYAQPKLLDLDTDGDFDVLIGDAGNDIFYAYENTGSLGATDNTLFGVAVNGSEKFRINAIGGVIVSGALTSTNLITATYGGTSDALVINQTGLGNLVNFKDGGTSAFVINNGGNVGVGTTSPGAKFAVGATSQFQVNASGNVTGGTYNGLTLTAATTGFTIAGGTTSKTLTVSNTLTLAGTDSSTLNIGTGGTLGTGAFATIANYAPIGQTMYIGTTAHAINRGTGAEVLTGITGLTPGANFVLTQNSVAALTSEETGAVANTLYLKAGNVGIGTTSPQGVLDIKGVSPVSIIGRPTTDSGSESITFGGSCSTCNNLQGGMRLTRNSVDAAWDLGLGGTVFGQGSMINAVTILGAGNVGIGTTSPTEKLMVAGNVAPSADDAYDLGSATNRWRDLYLGPASLHIAGNTLSNVAGSLTWNGQGVINSSGAATFNGANIGSGAFYVDSVSSNIGIGTTSPVYKLEVNGSAKVASLNINGAYSLPTAAGTTSQFLRGDGTWAAAGMSGSGTANYLSKFTGAATLGNSLIFDDGTNVGIGTTSPTGGLQLNTTSRNIVFGPGTGYSNIADDDNGLNFNVNAAPVADITFDASACTTKSWVGSSFSWDHTVGTFNNRLLIVGISGRSSGNSTSITYAGQALTKLSTMSVNGAILELWYLKNPPTGTNTVAVTKDANGENGMCASSYFNVEQATTFGTVGTASQSEGVWAINRSVSSASGELVVDLLGFEGADGSTATPDAGQTSRASSNSSFNGIRMSSKPGATSTTMGWTHGSWAYTGLIVVPIRRAASVFQGGSVLISKAGNVGIGTTTPSALLTVYNGTTTGTYTTSGWASSSDARLKTNIIDVTNPLDKIKSLSGVYFNWNANPSADRQIGLIAQDTLKVLPEVVVGNERDGYGIAYGNLSALLIEGIKAQQSQLSALTFTLQNSNSIQDNEIQKLNDALTLLTTNTQDQTQITNQKITSIQNNLITAGSQINLLSNKLNSANTLLSQNTQPTQELPFYQFKTQSPELSSPLENQTIADNQFAGTYNNPNNFQEINIQLHEENQLNLAEKDQTQTSLIYDVYIEDPTILEDFHTELGNQMDQKELEWNRPNHPNFISGWNTIKLPLMDGIKSGEIDFQKLSYFRAYFKFQTNTNLKFKNIRIETKATYQPLAQTIETQNLDLWNNTDQGTALKSIFAELELQNQTNLTQEALNTKLTTDLKSMQDQVALLQKQSDTFTQFLLAFDVSSVDNFAKKNAPINTFVGQLEAEGMVAGAFSVKVVDESAATIGIGAIHVFKDENLDEIDDNYPGNSGKNIVIKTRAVSSDSKIYLTPISSTKNQVLYVGEVTPGVGFEVKVDSLVTEKIEFNWWIVEKE